MSRSLVRVRALARSRPVQIIRWSVIALGIVLILAMTLIATGNLVRKPVVKGPSYAPANLIDTPAATPPAGLASGTKAKAVQALYPVPNQPNAYVLRLPKGQTPHLAPLKASDRARGITQSESVTEAKPGDPNAPDMRWKGDFEGSEPAHPTCYRVAKGRGIPETKVLDLCGYKWHGGSVGAGATLAQLAQVGLKPSSVNWDWYITWQWNDCAYISSGNDCTWGTWAWHANYSWALARGVTQFRSKPLCQSGSEIGWSTSFERCEIGPWNKPTEKVQGTVVARESLIWNGLPSVSKRFNQLNLYPNGHQSTCWGFGVPEAPDHPHCIDLAPAIY